MCHQRKANENNTPTRWPKSNPATTPIADKDVEQQELSFIAGGSAKW